MRPAASAAKPGKPEGRAVRRALGRDARRLKGPERVKVQGRWYNWLEKQNTKPHPVWNRNPAFRTGGAGYPPPPVVAIGQATGLTLKVV
jgi:hypothetical protein